MKGTLSFERPLFLGKSTEYDMSFGSVSSQS